MNIRYILLICSISIVSVYADDTLDATQLQEMHQLFMKQRSFNEALKTIALAKADDASQEVKDLAAHDMAFLKAMLTKKSGSQSSRKKIVDALRTQLVDLSRRTPHSDVYDVIAQELEDDIGDTHTPHPLSSLFDTYGTGMASTLYYGVDGFIDNMHRSSNADALGAVTPDDAWHDSQEKSMLPALSAAAGHGIGITKAAIPFVSEYGNDPSKHSSASKGLGAAHLGSRGINLLYHWLTRDANELTPDEAYALAYHNRRHGTPDYLQSEQERVKQMGRLRVALRILGQGILPTILAGTTGPDSDDAVYTSPALAVANTTGIADSLLGIYDRYRSSKAMQRLREEMPEMIQALEAAPPTDQERAEDAASAGIERFSVMDAMQQAM